MATLETVGQPSINTGLENLKFLCRLLYQWSYEDSRRVLGISERKSLADSQELRWGFWEKLKIIPKFYPIARQVAKCWARVDLAQLCVPQSPARLDLFHVTHRWLFSRLKLWVMFRISLHFSPGDSKDGGWTSEEEHAERSWHCYQGSLYKWMTRS